jgi:O-antigen/teichoic acid export membrane protein
MFNHLLFEFRRKYHYSKIVNDSFWSVCSHFVVGGLSLFIMWLITSYFTKEEYGLYLYLTYLIGFVSVLALSGADKELILEIANKKYGSYKFLFFKKILFSLIGSFVFFGLSLYWYFNSSIEVALFLFLVGFLFPFMNAFKLYNSFYLGKRSFFILFKLTSFREILFLLIVLFVVLMNYNFFIFFILTILGFFIFDAYSFYSSLKVINSNKIEKEITSNSWKFTGINSLPSILNFVDDIIMGSVLGMGALASYRVALMFPEEVKHLSGVVSSVLISRFAIKNYSKFKLLRIMFFSFLLNLLLVIILFIGVKFAIEYIFPDYKDIIIFAQLAFISALFVFPSVVLNTYLNAKRKFVDLTKVVFSTSILKFVGFVIFIPLFGIEGAISVIIIDDIIQFFILIYLVFR